MRFAIKISKQTVVQKPSPFGRREMLTYTKKR